MVDFTNATAEFSGFCARHGYPSKLLWVLPEEVLIWRGRIFVLAANPEAQRLKAKSVFDSAISRNVGVVMDGIGKTAAVSICCLYTAKDDADAQNRMIPKVGLKLSVANDPRPVVLVSRRFPWRLLNCFGRSVDC